MTTRVVTVTPDTPVRAIARLLRDNRISGVPVMDSSGAVIGLVSEHDLLAREGETAAEVMTGPVITVTEDTDVDDVRHLLVERRIRRVPVMQTAAETVQAGEAGEGGRRGRWGLAGIVSRGDVVALLTTEWVCQVCGEAARGEHPPAQCPRCHASRFALQDACPGD